MNAAKTACAGNRAFVSCVEDIKIFALIRVPTVQVHVKLVALKVPCWDMHPKKLHGPLGSHVGFAQAGANKWWRRISPKFANAWCCGTLQTMKRAYMVYRHGETNKKINPNAGHSGGSTGRDRFVFNCHNNPCLKHSGLASVFKTAQRDWFVFKRRNSTCLKHSALASVLTTSQMDCKILHFGIRIVWHVPQPITCH